MNAIGIAWRQLCTRPLAALLHLLLLALGLGAITFLLLVGTQLQRAFERDLAGIDLVVGAKGSPMQLILSGVFHIDQPTGNVPLAAVQELSRNDLVAEVIPISLGDNIGGWRIVGTTPAYIAHYGARLARGQAWKQPLEAVVGATVAQQTGLAVGARFVGAHGLGQGGHAHGENPYTVTGVLASCGCVLDRLVLTSSESVWKVHEGATAVDADDLEALQAEREVTLALVRYRTPLAAVSLPRSINANTEMQAAAPAVEVTRLLSMIGIGTDVLRAFAGVLLLSAAMSVFIALWHAVRERRADLAMLRMLGAPPRRVAALVLSEALILGLLGSLLGLVLGHGMAHLLGLWMRDAGSLPLEGALWVGSEWTVPALGLGVAVLAAILPAWEVYRLDPLSVLRRR